MIGETISPTGEPEIDADLRTNDLDSDEFTENTTVSNRRDERYCIRRQQCWN
jgi:hypothetical protein